MGFNLDSFDQPLTEVPTSLGTLYLYRFRTKDLEEFMMPPKVDSMSRIREFLPRVASLTLATGSMVERPSLSQEEISRLSDDEIEDVAEFYTKEMLKWLRSDDSPDRPNRDQGERATSYLGKLLVDEANISWLHARKINDAYIASFNSILNGVRASTMRLGSTLSVYDKLKHNMTTSDLHMKSGDTFRVLNEQLHNQSLERAKERKETHEMTRLTLQLTAESAMSLKLLVEASTALLEQIEVRNKKSEKDTRTQLLIGVIAVLTSAILSGLSFIQDRKNYESGDRWQHELLDSLRQTNTFESEPGRRFKHKKTTLQIFTLK